MIKINLLPGRIAEGRKVRGLMKLIILVVLVEIIGLSFMVYRLAEIEKQRTTDLKNVTALADEVRKLNNKVKTTQMMAKPYIQQVQWYEGIHKRNARFPDVLLRINEYVYEKLTVRSLKLNGNAVVIDAATKDLDHLASSYFNMLRNKYMIPGSLHMTVGGGGGGGGGRNSARRGGGGRPGGGGRASRRARGTGGGGSRTAAQANENTGGGGNNQNEKQGVGFTYTLKPQYGLVSGPAAAATATTNTGNRNPRMGGSRGPGR